MNQSSQTTTTTRKQFPVSDVFYDVVTILHEKLQGLDALNKYEQDAQQGGHQRFAQLIQKIRQNDTECINELKQILDNNLHQGQGH